MFVCELTLWYGPFDDGEVGRKAFLSDGAVGVDCQCQDARVGDDPAGGVLPTVPSDVWADCRQEEGGGGGGKKKKHFLGETGGNSKFVFLPPPCPTRV